MSITWEEFQKDNPFNLTERQFNRSRKYFPGYVKPINIRKREYHYHSSPAKYKWVCYGCGKKGRGAKNLIYCRKGFNCHRKLYHDGEYIDYEIIKIGGE